MSPSDIDSESPTYFPCNQGAVASNEDEARERARAKEESERARLAWKLDHPRSLGVYIILLLLFGAIGLHDFYAGRIAGGIFQLIVGSILLILTAITLGIGLILLVPWSLLCLILGLCHLKDVDGVPMR